MMRMLLDEASSRGFIDTSMTKPDSPFSHRKKFRSLSTRESVATDLKPYNKYRLEKEKFDHLNYLNSSHKHSKDFYESRVRPVILAQKEYDCKEGKNKHPVFGLTQPKAFIKDKSSIVLRPSFSNLQTEDMFQDVYGSIFNGARKKTLPKIDSRITIEQMDKSPFLRKGKNLATTSSQASLVSEIY